MSRALAALASLALDGLFPLVTHAFNFVGRGALGRFQAGDGEPQE